MVCYVFVVSDIKPTETFEYESRVFIKADRKQLSSGTHQVGLQGPVNEGLVQNSQG